MSKESFIRGWVKAASANGVDPTALARMSDRGQEKEAEGEKGFWDGIRKSIDDAATWYKNQDPVTRAAIGAGLGAGAGTLLGAPFRRKGLGAAVGAVAGAAAGGSMDRVRSWLDEYKTKRNLASVGPVDLQAAGIPFRDVLDGSWKAKSYRNLGGSRLADAAIDRIKAVNPDLVARQQAAERAEMSTGKTKPSGLDGVIADIEGPAEERARQAINRVLAAQR